MCYILSINKVELYWSTKALQHKSPLAFFVRKKLQIKPETETRKNFLILKSDRTDFERFYIEHMQREDVCTYPIYKFKSGLFWYVMVIWIEKLKLPFSFLFYNNKWKKDVRHFESIIVFDRNLSWNIFNYIKRKNPEARCIAWYWNPVMFSRSIPDTDKNKTSCECWSFDQHDCSRYGLKRNVQFYFNNLQNDKTEKIEFDAFYVGTDKGRYEKISEIISTLDGLGYKTYKGVIKDKLSSEIGEYIKPLKYDQIISLIKNSNCIIDIPQNNQKGLTVRVLEALFWKKKLITTDPGIKDYEFYHDNNILIWESPSDEDIINFFSKDMVNIDPEIVEKYSFDSWLRNFMN